MLAVIDMHISNISSLANALERVGARFEVTSDPQAVLKADSVILPGVGAFAVGMAYLNGKGLSEAVREAARCNKPILGICLGMQLLSSQSEEFGLHDGLGLVEGRAVRLNPRDSGCRVPNIGWCDTSPMPGSCLFPAKDGAAAFYYVHSYYLAEIEDRNIAATIDFADAKICAALERGRVFGVQFHPEKSQDHGLELLYRFAALSGDAA